MNAKDQSSDHAYEDDILATRAWEARDSPADLGFCPLPGWGQLPAGWDLTTLFR